MEKLQNTGVVEDEKRGGRPPSRVAKDKILRDSVESHINRFPKVESHYCRSSTSKEYLYPDLTLQKMYAMYIEENKENQDRASYSTYARVFKDLNLAFHRPKKDMCSLCETYFKGDEETKLTLKERFLKHESEKKSVRDLKEDCKQAAQKDPKILCGTFDLQQVIYTPISNDSQIFYKRRLSNYNLTFYNIGTRDCTCFLWHEGMSRRGSCEVGTAVHLALTEYDKQGVTCANLFADGCTGQNKNSIIPAMLLYTLYNSNNLEKVSLRYFETSHGQSEGDSAHSAITTAMKNVGQVSVPSQLIPIFKLARKMKPYLVKVLEHDDFLDFKLLSQELRILNVRTDSETSEKINWTQMMEIMVEKESPSTIFYKTSHTDDHYKSIILKRQQVQMKDVTLKRLNKGPRKLSKEKYNNLISLCNGDTPVVRLREHQDFYKSLEVDL